MPSSKSFSRRGFLAAGLGASAAALASTRLRAQASPAQPQGLPPAIAALPNLTGKARPFTNAERQARIERAKTLMASNKIDAIVLANQSASAVYFAELHMWGGERLWALTIPAKAKPFLVCPAFEEGRARELLDSGPLGKDAEVITWQENESPFVALGKALRDRGLATGTIGLDEHMAFMFSDGIRRANPQLTLTSATPITAGCRMIKEPHELDCMRLANHATLLVYRAVAHSVHPGITNADVEALVDAAYKQVGFPGDASLNIDEYTALPHGSRQPQTLREGSILMLDDGCLVEGYTSDITRTFVLGKPTDKMKRVFDLVLRAQTTALKTARPGVTAASVDAAARKVIADGGYGPGFKFFSHRLGHGIGLEGHEWPYFVENNMFGWDTAPLLKPGMTLSDEPGVYIKGEFGIRLEDDLVITENGAEMFTPQSPSIEDPFGGMD
ncbi:MAG TPA: Xaa-Pro peptidase family protein [Terracidiphilus sp.]